MFKVMGALGSTNPCTNPAVISLNSVQVQSCASYYLPNPYSFNLTLNARKDFYMYNPVVVAGNPGYTSLSVQLVSGSDSTVYLCTFNVPDCVASQTRIDSRSLNSAVQLTWISPPLHPATPYDL